MQYADHILETYESRPRKWWQYTLFAVILALLMGWSASSITFKGLATKGMEVASGIFWGLVKPNWSMIFTTATGLGMIFGLARKLNGSASTPPTIVPRIAMQTVSISR